jgi:hypothetical protein
MTEPIVSPILVYLIGVCDTVWTGALCVAMVGAIFCTIVFILASLDAYDYGEFDKKAAKLLKTFFFVTCVCALLALFVPSSETAIAMLVAKNVTPETIRLVERTAAESVEIITNAILQAVQGG